MVEVYIRRIIPAMHELDWEFLYVGVRHKMPLEDLFVACVVAEYIVCWCVTGGVDWCPGRGADSACVWIGIGEKDWE